ncbi:AAA family ATPase, partial [Streptococcus pneumoniae]|uniref:AAA family ATPase n=1 Tax=Streptococcus pneumoniae TaxID=1313 RepID=UPI000AFD8BC0
LFNEINNLPFKQNYIILFDEIDSIVLDRVNQNDLREMGRVTSAFLKELDRLSPEIVLIATTNLFENLDKAVTRRFDAIIDFDRYTDEDKVEVATIILAFSDPSDPHDYQKRLLRSLHNGRNLSISKLSKLGFTVREIEILTGISKSSVSRE